MELLRWIFSTDFMPSVQCIKYDPLVLTARLLGDGMFFVAYMVIPYLLYKHRTARSMSSTIGKSVTTGFMAFIFFCGVSHLDDIIMLVWPARRVDAVIRITGGAISLTVTWMLSAAVARVLQQVKTLAAERDELEQTVKESQARLIALQSRRNMQSGGLEPAG